MAAQSSSVKRFSMQEIREDLLPTWFGAQPDFTLTYTDDEGDHVTITSDVELVEALAVAGGQGLSVLKLAVYPSRAAAQHPHEGTPAATNSTPAPREPKNSQDNKGRAPTSKYFHPCEPVCGSACRPRGPPPAPTALHVGVLCDGCGQFPIRGPRFKHLSFDFDLCAHDFAELSAAEQAWFERVDAPLPRRHTTRHPRVCGGGHAGRRCGPHGGDRRCSSAEQWGVASPEDLLMQLCIAESLAPTNSPVSASQPILQPTVPAAELIHAFTGLEDVATATAAILQAFAPPSPGLVNRDRGCMGKSSRSSTQDHDLGAAEGPETKDPEPRERAHFPSRPELPPLAQLIASLGTHARSAAPVNMANHGSQHPCFGTAPSSEHVVHWGITCDATGQSPIVGTRYHLPGADWDLCQAAFEVLSEAEKLMYAIIRHPGAKPIKYVDLASDPSGATAALAAGFASPSPTWDAQAGATKIDVASSEAQTEGVVGSFKPPPGAAAEQEGEQSGSNSEPRRKGCSPVTSEQQASSPSPSGSAEFEDLAPPLDHIVVSSGRGGDQSSPGQA